MPWTFEVSREGEDELAKWIELWDSINAKRGYPWEADPPVWAVRFSVASTAGRPA